MRVIRPRKLLAVDDDRHVPAVEDLEQAVDRRIRRHASRACCSLRPTPVRRKRAALAHDREQHVGFVDDADDFLVLEHRKLRHVVELEALDRR